MHHRQIQKSSHMDQLSHRYSPIDNSLEKQLSFYFISQTHNRPALMHDGVKQNSSFSTVE